MQWRRWENLLWKKKSITNVSILLLILDQLHMKHNNRNLLLKIILKKKMNKIKKNSYSKWKNFSKKWKIIKNLFSSKKNLKINFRKTKILKNFCIVNVEVRNCYLNYNIERIFFSKTSCMPKKQLIISPLR